MTRWQIVYSLFSAPDFVDSDTVEDWVRGFAKRNNIETSVEFEDFTDQMDVYVTPPGRKRMLFMTLMVFGSNVPPID